MASDMVHEPSPTRTQDGGAQPHAPGLTAAQVIAALDAAAANERGSHPISRAVRLGIRVTAIELAAALGATEGFAVLAWVRAFAKADEPREAA